jgi:hypothetical protein
MRQVIIPDGILQGVGDMCLTDYAVETYRTVFAGRYYKIAHVVFWVWPGYFADFRQR